ncbi:hypothetical protein [Butyrivibrio sp. AC2005]|uniref:hypothetical protein n=1 Tax=Butyrivibrio sp. AC2005 TaxID=1280672 RepID=UPI0004221211|nr:hypothetical protein [Butyrivibrio sp. AC2005]
MAKHTQKNDALGMFASTTPVKINKPKPKVEEKPAAEEKPTKKKAEDKKATEKKSTQKAIKEIDAQTVTNQEMKTDVSEEAVSTLAKEEPAIVEEQLVQNEEDVSPVTPSVSPLGITLDMTVKKSARSSRGRSFYLSDAIFEKLSNRAKANNVSTSEYLEFILKQVL